MFSLLFVGLSIFFYFYEIPLKDNYNKFIRWWIQNFSLSWLIWLFLLIIEGQYYWTRFAKKQLQIITEQNEKINTQKEEILVQNEILQQQKEEIEVQRDEVVEHRDKIQYQNQ